MSGINGISTVILAADGETYSRLFGLDAQLLMDACITAVAVFVLFLFLSKLLFNPARELLQKRQSRITDDLETAEKSKKDSIQLKAF